MLHYTELSLSAQTAYAQLFDAAMAAELSRTVASLNGSFARKQVKGREYWYFQYTDLSGVLRQIYIGPDSPAIQTLIAQRAAQGANDTLGAMGALARSAMALGGEPLLRRHFRVIRRLADYGFFRAGGVVVGTHAFLAYGNMLGVKWGDTSRTQDVDFAHAGKNISIALPSTIEVNTHDAIESLQMGLLPTGDFSGKAGGSYLNPKSPDFRLDFLTTLHRGGTKPYEHARLNVTLQPLKFMEFSLEGVVQAALFSEDGAVVVNLPHPARYCLHKLLVYGERHGSYVQKAHKDLLQAAALMTYLKEHRVWELQEAWKDLIGRGGGWTTRARQGVAALDKIAPELDAKRLLIIGSKAKR